MPRPFHFTVDPLSPATFDTDNDGAAHTWTHSGSTVVATLGASDSRLIRQTDTADNADVEARMKSSSGASGPFGVVANWQDGNNFYMFYWVSGTTLRLYRKTSGSYVILSSKAKTYSNDNYVRMRLVTANNGGNKDLSGYVNGVLELGPTSTSTVNNNGRAGFDANATAGSSITIDWFAFNTVISVTSATPNTGGLNGGEIITLAGDDFGEGCLVNVDTIGAGTNVTVSPETSINFTNPSNFAGGTVDITVKFGTLGSEEYTGTLNDGFTYSTTAGSVNIDVSAVRLNI